MRTHGWWVRCDDNDLRWCSDRPAKDRVQAQARADRIDKIGECDHAHLVEWHETPPTADHLARCSCVEPA